MTTDDPPVLLGDNLTIACVDFTASEVTADWTTTAPSADLSDQEDSFLTALRVSTLSFTDIDSGYCGTYTCSFMDTSSSISTDVDVGKYNS